MTNANVAAFVHNSYLFFAGLTMTFPSQTQFKWNMWIKRFNRMRRIMNMFEIMIRQISFIYFIYLN